MADLIPPSVGRHLTGLTPALWVNWTNKVLLKSEDKPGQGGLICLNFHKLLALMTGACYYRAGFGIEDVYGIIRTVADMPLEHIEANINQGKVFVNPSMIVDGEYLPGWLMPMPTDVSPGLQHKLKNLDLKKIFQHLLNAVPVALADPKINTTRGIKRTKGKPHRPVGKPSKPVVGK